MPDTSAPPAGLTLADLSPIERSAAIQAEQEGGILPKPDQPQQPQVDPYADIPTWDSITNSDIYKKASRTDQANILQRYTDYSKNAVAQTLSDPQEIANAQKHVDDFYNRERESQKDYGADIGYQTERTAEHAAVTTTAGIVKGMIDLPFRLAQLPGAKPSAITESIAQPGIRTSNQDITGMTVDQAKDDLAREHAKEDDLQTKLDRLNKYEEAKRNVPKDNMEEARNYNLNLAKEYPEFNDNLYAPSLRQSQRLLQTRIDTLNNFIASGGDKGVVPEDEVPQTAATKVAKVTHKMVNWFDKNVLTPDEAFARDHPQMSKYATIVGNVAPYIALHPLTEGLTDLAGIPEASGALSELSTATATQADMFQNGYETGKAKLEARRKAGEDISPEAMERMAVDYAFKSSFGAPAQVVANLLVSRLVGGGVEAPAAQGLIGRLFDNVLKPSLGEVPLQLAIGTGTQAWNDLAAKWSGVSKEGITGDTWKEGLDQGGVFAALGLGGRLFHTVSGRMADQSAIKDFTQTVNQHVDGLTKADPTITKDDARDHVITATVPDRYKDAVKSELAKKDAAQALSESSIGLDASGSTKSAEEQAKLAETVSNTSTAPKTTEAKPEEKTTEVEKKEPGEGEAEGEGEGLTYTAEREPKIIRAAFENGHITAEQHAELQEDLKEGDFGTAITKLGDIVKAGSIDELEHKVTTTKGSVRPAATEAAPTEPAAEAETKPTAEAEAKPTAEAEAKPAAEVTPTTEAEAKPAEAAAAAPTTPAKSPLVQLQDRVNEYFGAGAGAQNKFDLAHDFMAEDWSNKSEADRRADAQLLHRLALQRRNPQTVREWLASVKPEEENAALQRFNSFLDKRIAGEGTFAEKPTPEVVPGRAIPHENFFQMMKEDNWKELHHRLAGGETLVLPEDVATSEDVDSWLSGEKRGWTPFNVSVDKDGNYTLGPIEGYGGAYSQLAEQAAAGTPLTKEGEIRKSGPKGGRPKMMDWQPRGSTPEYERETDQIPSHPAEGELTDSHQGLFGKLEKDIPGNHGATARIYAQNKYQRELRKWYQNMVASGRAEDANLIADRTKTIQRLKALPEDSSDRPVLHRRVKDLTDQIEALAKDKGELPPEPYAGQITKSVAREFYDWRKTHAGTESLEEKVGGGEEGEGVERGETIRAQPSAFEEEHARMAHGEDVPEGDEHAPLTEADAEHAAAVGGLSPSEHEKLVTDYAKTLKTNIEKRIAWETANNIVQAAGVEPLKIPSNLEELPRTRGEESVRKRRQLQEATAYGYLRFLERSTGAGRAGEGAAEGGEAAAAAAGGTAVPPGGHEEVPGGAVPGHPAAGESGYVEGALESATPSGRNKGPVSSGGPADLGPRDTVAGLPEPTTEGAGRPLGPETELLRTSREGGASGAGTTGDAGRVVRAPASGERIFVTPEGNERGRGAPRITPEEETLFRDRVDKQVGKTADAIWKEWLTKGESEQARLMGLHPGDYKGKAELAEDLRQLVYGQTKQEPSLGGKLRIAMSTLTGTHPPDGEMSSSQLRRDRAYANQRDLVTTTKQITDIHAQEWKKVEAAFASMGVTREAVPNSPRTDQVQALKNGQIVYVHSPSVWEQFADRKDVTEGQLRNLVASMLEEELIHAAHLDFYRDQWKAQGSQGDFRKFVNTKGENLLGEFAKARYEAEKRGDMTRANALDKLIGSSVKSYWGREMDGADRVNSVKDFYNWYGKLSDEDRARVSFQLPYEMTRQGLQMDIFHRSTEFQDRRLITTLRDYFMQALQHLRRIGLRVREGALGQVWKDTYTTLEKRVRDLQDLIDSGETKKTSPAQMRDQSVQLASKLGKVFFDNPEKAEKYGYRFDDARDADHYADQLLAKIEGPPDAPRSNPELTLAKLTYMGRQEGLVDPPRGPDQPMALGKMASLAPGIGDVHVLNEGRTDRLARYFRASDDPEMRAYGASLTPYREHLMGVNIRQLNHPVPAAFYHNGDLWVTNATLEHPDGQKAMAHELQHAVAQEILANAKTPQEHEVVAHAHALAEEFKRRLPADIRDAVDTKFQEWFDNYQATGKPDWDNVTDEERKWFPLIEAATNPTEFVRKAFSSSNFRDFLRTMKADRGDMMWDNVNDWGRTMFGNQAFKYAPEVGEITYNRPGAAMTRDPRVGTPEFDAEVAAQVWAMDARERTYKVREGAKSILKQITDLSDQPRHRALATALSKALEDSPDVKVQIGHHELGGAYYFLGDQVKIHPAAAMNDRQFEEFALHEIVHALTSGKISAYLQGQHSLLTRSERIGLNELENIRRIALQHKDVPEVFRQIDELPTYDQKVEAFMKAGADNYYGLINLHEFASEALSNGYFQNFLDRIPYRTGEPQSMLGKVFDWLRTFLGYRKGYGLEATLRNISRVMEGRRLMRADFESAGTTASKTRLMTESELRTQFIENKARAEGYAKMEDVPHDKIWSWMAWHRDQYGFTGLYDPRMPLMISPPERNSIVQPSDELAKKSDPMDIVEHIAKITGTPLHDGDGLAKAVEKAFDSKAITINQYLATQDVIKDLNYATLNKVKVLGERSDPNSPQRKLDDFIKSFHSEGSLPKAVHQVLLEKGMYAKAAFAYKLNRWTDELDRMFKTHIGNPGDVPAVLMERYNKVLDGTTKNAPASMPGDIFSHLQEGRAMIDDMSDQLLKSGFIKPGSKLYIDIQKKKGKYVARSYKMFRDLNWMESPESQKSQAAAIGDYKRFWIGTQAADAGQKAARLYPSGTTAALMAKIRAAARETARLTATTTDAIAQQKMMDQLSTYRSELEQREGGVRGTPAVAVNEDLFKDLTHLPASVREAMGEEKDVRKNLVNTMLRMNNYLSSMNVAKGIAEADGGIHIGDHYDAARNWTHPIPEHADFLGTLAGKYTSKEIQKALIGYDHVQRNLPAFIPGLNSLENGARYLTTILSIRRGVGNVWSGALNLIGNGMIPYDPRHWVSGTRALFHEGSLYSGHLLFHGSDDARQAEIMDAMKYGIVDKAGDAHLLGDMMANQAKYSETGRGPMDWLEGMQAFADKHPMFRGVKEGSKRFLEGVQAMHTAGNDISKMYQWKVQQERVREQNQWAVQNRGAIAMTPEEIKTEAARIVRDTNISYSLNSPIIKQARRVQAVGVFLSYWNEMMRSNIAKLGYALRYIDSANPVQRAEGYRRLVGLLSTWTIAPALHMASMKLFGVTPREDDNFRQVVSPWEQNQTRIYGPMRNGQRIYMNMDYMLPHGDISRAFMALTTPSKDGLSGNLLDAANELFHPLTSFGLMPGAVIDIARNQTTYGTQVYNPEDYWWNNLGGMGKYLAGRYFGGTVGRVGRLVPQPTTKGGLVYNPILTLASELGGMDWHDISIPDRFRSNMASSKDNLTNAQRIFTEPIQRTNNQMTDQAMSAAYQHMESVRRIVFSQLRQQIEAARNSGMSTKEIKNVLKQRRYSSDLVNDLMTGRYHPYIPGGGILDNAKAVGNHVPRYLFSRQAKSYEEPEEGE